jgi:hypothetical protein
MKMSQNLVVLRLYNTFIKFVDSSMFDLAKKSLPKVQIRSHDLRVARFIEELFNPKGNPVAEEILEHIEE